MSLTVSADAKRRIVCWSS